MSKVSQQFAEGELVTIQIKSARVAAFIPGDHATVGEITVEMGVHNIEAVVPLAYGVTVERVAPAEWPPQIGDIWTDRDGSEWVADDTDGETILMRRLGGGGSTDALDVLDMHGPMTLIRRRGWSPAADTTPAAPEPEQVDKRAELVAALRELLHRLESNPSMPAPNSIRAQCSYYGDDDAQRANIERDAAALGIKLESWTVRDDTGDTAISGDLILGGHVLYTLYARVAGAKPAVVELSDAQLDAAEAAGDGPPAGCECDDCLDEREATPHRKPEPDGRLSLPEALADAFPEPEPELVQTVMGPVLAWSIAERDVTVSIELVAAAELSAAAVPVSVATTIDQAGMTWAVAGLFVEAADDEDGRDAFATSVRDAFLRELGDYWSEARLRTALIRLLRGQIGGAS
jgi:hypothetical protein